jgi:Ca-activated chloride channel homolog
MPIPGDFSFARPELFLLLVALLPAAWAFWRTRRHEGIVLRGEDDYRRAFGSGQLLRTAMVSSIALSLVSIVCILARPEISQRHTAVSAEGIDIAIVLDLSKSMLAEDMPPNRIGAAKEVIGDFLRRLDGDRVGIVLFAGKPFISVPLSFDYEGVAAMVGRITTDSIDQNAGMGLQ